MKLDRRNWTKLGALMASGFLARQASAAPQRKFTLDLCPGRIGVRVGQRECIELAAEFGFESVEPFGSELARIGKSGCEQMLELLKTKNLVWGAAGLPIQFREDEAKFQSDLKAFKNIAQVLHDCGVTRVGTWLMPGHDTLTFYKTLICTKKDYKVLQRCWKIMISFWAWNTLALKR